MLIPSQLILNLRNVSFGLLLYLESFCIPFILFLSISLSFSHENNFSTSTSLTSHPLA